METTPEFIVKVLDDDVSTSNVKQIVAVNIMPVTSRGEKIIVGGAMVPPPTSSVSSADLPKDYTRFVPPSPLTTTQNPDENYVATRLSPTVAEGPEPIRPPSRLYSYKYFYENKCIYSFYFCR